jgi:FkbM family methyltransferase
MTIKTKLYEGWHVLDSDSSLKRVVKWFAKKGVSDFSIDNYEKHMIDEANEHVKKKKVAIDIGANYGIVTSQLAKEYKKVHAFELVPDVRHCLEKNMKKFKHDNVEIHPYGVGRYDEKIDVKFCPSSSFGTNIENRDIHHSAKTSSMQIKSLDSLNLDRVDLIKIDAEGSEVSIIKGALNLIVKCKPVIIFEHKFFPRARILKIINKTISKSDDFISKEYPERLDLLYDYISVGYSDSIISSSVPSKLKEANKIKAELRKGEAFNKRNKRMKKHFELSHPSTNKDKK